MFLSMAFQAITTALIARPVALGRSRSATTGPAGADVGGAAGANRNGGGGAVAEYCAGTTLSCERGGATGDRAAGHCCDSGGAAAHCGGYAAAALGCAGAVGIAGAGPDTGTMPDGVHAKRVEPGGAVTGVGATYKGVVGGATGRAGDVNALAVASGPAEVEAGLGGVGDKTVDMPPGGGVVGRGPAVGEKGAGPADGVDAAVVTPAADEAANGGAGLPSADEAGLRVDGDAG